MAIGIEFSLFMWPSSGFLHISRGAASPFFVLGLGLSLNGSLLLHPSSSRQTPWFLFTALSLSGLVCFRVDGLCDGESDEMFET